MSSNIPRSLTGVALTLALCGSATPAQARWLDLNANGSYVPAGSPSMTIPATPSTGEGNARPVARVTAPGDGFDWADAGIGAAGGFALSLIGVGGALAISQSRSRRTTG